MKEQQILKVLELAERGELPDCIEDDSVVPSSIVKLLFDSGYLDAIDASSLDGLQYIEPSINVRGRQYLKVLRKQRYEESLRGNAARIGAQIFKWFTGILTALIIAWVTWKYFN